MKKVLPTRLGKKTTELHTLSAHRCVWKFSGSRKNFSLVVKRRRTCRKCSRASADGNCGAFNSSRMPAAICRHTPNFELPQRSCCGNKVTHGMPDFMHRPTLFG